ncbi:hypothetical protein D3C87_1821140 [compost metagenome]
MALTSLIPRRESLSYISDVPEDEKSITISTGFAFKKSSSSDATATKGAKSLVYPSE